VKQRIINIFNNIEKKIDNVIIKNSSDPFIDNNFFYATGLDKGLFEGSAAILYPEGKIDLIVSELEAETANKAKAELKVYKNISEYNEIFSNTIKSKSNIGLNFNCLSHLDYCKFKEKFPNANFIDVSEALSKTRSVKDNIEIDLIRKSCNIVDRVIKEIPSFIKDGMYEYELAAEIDYLMQKNGADKPAFDTISSFGKNSAEPHYTHGNKKIVNGDFVLCDFGAHFKKYNSDITRTFVFGKASEKQKNMYKTVLEAQRIGFETAKSKVKANLVHNKVDQYINNSEFKGCFTHTTGHSIGLDVHDPGIGFSNIYETGLKENMTLTIEPGVYIPGFGGVRIEDDVLIKKDRIEILTKSPRDLIEI